MYSAYDGNFRSVVMLTARERWSALMNALYDHGASAFWMKNGFVPITYVCFCKACLLTYPDMSPWRWSSPLPSRQTMRPKVMLEQKG